MVSLRVVSQYLAVAQTLHACFREHRCKEDGLETYCEGLSFPCKAFVRKMGEGMEERKGNGEREGEGEKTH